MLAINIKPDLRGVQKAFINLKAKQAPFAISLALNALAKGVVGVEQDEILKDFDTPTPFTQKAMRIEASTKSKPVARVAVKDIQADYLAPYVLGGNRSYGKKKGMLAPRSVPLNQYGNLTKGKLKALEAKPNVFIGKVVTKSGRTINGVWQRPGPGRKGKPAGGLKLLIQFEDTTPVKKHFAFYERATAYVRRNAAREFQIAMQRALATAK